MSEMLNGFIMQYILPALGSIVVALSGWAVKKLVDFLDEKTKFMDSERDIMRKNQAKANLVEAVETSVMEITQTFTDSLKKSREDGKLTPEEAKEAFSKARERAYSLLSTETVNLVNTAYEKDVKEVIDSKIEEVIGRFKVSGLLKK